MSAAHQPRPRGKGAQARVDALAADLQNLTAEGGGLCRLCLVDQEEVLGLGIAALSGSADAARVLIAAAEFLRGVQRAPKREPILCVACDRSIRTAKQFRLAVLLPDGAAPTQGLTSAVCHHCGPSKREAEQKALAYLRTIWPEFRSLRDIHPAGRA